MYYKVIYGGKVIDVLDRLDYVKYQKKHNRMILCDVSEAQAILSSNGESAWHVNSLLRVPVSGFDTVELEEIDRYEYKQLKALDINASESIRVIDMFVKSLVYNDVNRLIDSLKRLYNSQAIDKQSVIEFCNRNEIAEDIVDYILDEDE